MTRTADTPDANGRRPGRRPGRTATRDAILTAAREQFAERGYDKATIRGIARAAGVDPALVHHFFGNKEGVFVAAMRFPIDPTTLLPRILAAGPDHLGEAMVGAFLEVWEDEARRAPLLAMLRSAMTNDQAAAMMREFITAALFSRAGEIQGIPQIRINAAAGQMIGVMVLRHVLEVEPIASATAEELITLLAPTIQNYLGGPAD